MLPPSFINQQAGMEAMLQNAAKGARGVLEKSEKLGINQVVRDAVGEIKRNVVQGLNESLQPPRRETPTPSSAAEAEAAMTALVALELRNKQLASMLEETVSSLKVVSASNLDDKTKSLELIEIAAAKVQFVKIYLEDTSMEVPTDVTSPNLDTSMHVDQDALSDALLDIQMASNLDIPQMSPLSSIDDVSPTAEEDEKEKVATTTTTTTAQTQESTNGGTPKISDPLSSKDPNERPEPVPRRSTLAQSSFSWMLEPNEISSVSSRMTSKSPPATSHKKGPSGSASREKNAFLFGEMSSGTEMIDKVVSNDIFGMEPLRKAPSKN